MRRAMAGVLTLVLALLTIVVGAPVAAAAPAGITAELQLNGTTYEGTPVVQEGDELSLRVQYTDEVEPGSSVTFALGAGVTLSGVPSGNTAIANVSQSGNSVTITFADPWPSDVNQGVFDLDFTVNSVTASAPGQITWEIDGEPSSVDVIIRNAGDEFANVSNGQSKNLSPDLYTNNISTTQAGVVTVNPNIIGAALTTYTLRVTSAEARDDLVIGDTLPAPLAYLSGTFTAQLTTWDANGLNRQTNSFPYTPNISGNSFTSTVDLPAESILVITYQVTIPDEAARVALQAELQDAADDLAGEPGNFFASKINTATFGSESRDATLRLRGTVPAAPGPTPGNQFGKSSNWQNQELFANPDGSLTPPEDITYTLRANLGAWDGSGGNFNLTRNVVIRDTLPAQASWNTAASDFITLTSAAGPITGLTQATTGVTCDDATFSANDYVGQYCVTGQTLLINVGQASATDLTVAARAQVTTVTGLPEDGTSPIAGGTRYRLRNTADFLYRSGGPYTATRDAFLVTLPSETEGGLNDASAFAKTGSPANPRVNPGERATMNYVFRVQDGKAIPTLPGQSIDVANTRIVDELDPEYFDIADPELIASLTGTYGSTPLVAADFVTSFVDGNLVVELSAAGEAKAVPAGQLLTVNLALRTRPFVGKETLSITNRATLAGTNDQTLYWSENRSEATSFGDEAEVRKTLFDAAEDDWVRTLKARRNADGTLAQDVFTYRVEFIPRGSYDNVVIAPVNDVLPAGVSFLGFVTEANAATGADPQPGPVDIGGNIEATYTAGVVTLRQQTGTRLDADDPIVAYFAVRVDDPSATVPIVNTIGSSQAIIVPVSYAVGDYVWIDADRDGLQDAGEQVLAGVTVDLLDDAGAVVATTTTDPTGRYLFDNLPAGVYQVRFTLTPAQAARYAFTQEGAGSTDADDSDAVVQAGGATGLTRQFVLDGSNTALTTDYDRQVLASEGIDPTWDAGVVLKSVSVGDYVWVDSDRDGRQDPGEPGIPGVVLTLVGPDGEPVVDVDGNPVGPVTTGPNGEYSFDKLPALTGDQTYTVVIDREASAEALRPYRPTSAGRGDRAGDSSTWTATTQPGDLQEDGDRDPTLDFGFVAKTYAIGDLVWIDANRNGLQDEDEDILSDVTVELLDSAGEVIATTTTDENGRYLFDNLLAGTYQVRFTLTSEQQSRYRFTSRDAGSDAADSDADPATGLTVTIVLDDSNTALTGDYEYAEVLASEGIDPTWDAGVVLIEEDPIDEDPDDVDSDEDEELARTGVDPLLPAGLAGLLVTAGLVLVGIRRRRGAEL